MSNYPRLDYVETMYEGNGDVVAELAKGLCRSAAAAVTKPIGSAGCLEDLVT